MQATFYLLLYRAIIVSISELAFEIYFPVSKSLFFDFSIF